MDGDPLRGRLNSWLSRPWALVPFQPILFFFLFVGTIHVIGFSIPNSMEIAVGHVTYHVWAALGVGCPPLLLVSWLMIRFGNSHMIYAAMWLRLGADMGQLFALAAFGAARLAYITSYGEPGLYVVFITAACLLFLSLLVVRDVAKLILVERVARRLNGRRV